MGFISEHHNKYQTGGLQHLHAEQIRREVGEDRYLAYFKFAFVRNPYDRALSQYIFMSRRPDLRRYLGMELGASFSEYLELITKKLHVQWEEQRAFVLDSDSHNLLVDYIGRVETFERDARFVFDRLGITVDSIPHVNAGCRGDYRPYYSNSDRRLVEDFYAADLEMFNYVF
jgi:hypothetical protein